MLDTITHAEEAIKVIIRSMMAENHLVTDATIASAAGCAAWKIGELRREMGLKRKRGGYQERKPMPCDNPRPDPVHSYLSESGITIQVFPAMWASGSKISWKS